MVSISKQLVKFYNFEPEICRLCWSVKIRNCSVFVIACKVEVYMSESCFSFFCILLKCVPTQPLHISESECPSINGLIIFSWHTTVYVTLTLWECLHSCFAGTLQLESILITLQTELCGTCHSGNLQTQHIEVSKYSSPSSKLIKKVHNSA